MSEQAGRAMFAVVGLAALAIAIPTAFVMPEYATTFAIIAIAAAMFMREIKP